MNLFFSGVNFGVALMCAYNGNGFAVAINIAAGLLNLYIAHTNLKK